MYSIGMELIFHVYTFMINMHCMICKKSVQLNERFLKHFSFLKESFTINYVIGIFFY